MKQGERKLEGQLHGAIYALMLACNWSAEKVRAATEAAIKDAEEDRK